MFSKTPRVIFVAPRMLKAKSEARSSIWFLLLFHIPHRKIAAVVAGIQSFVPVVRKFWMHIGIHQGIEVAENGTDFRAV